MAMTTDESRWVASVMHTINRVSLRQPINAAPGSFQDDAGEDVLRAAQRFIQVVKDTGNQFS